MPLQPRDVLTWWRRHWAARAVLDRAAACRRTDRQDQDLRQDVAAALREWHAAEQHFQSVSDPELVDHAIFSLEAARRKYIYLLKLQQRRRQGTGTTSG